MLAGYGRSDYSFSIFMFWGCVAILLYKIFFERKKSENRILFLIVFLSLIVIISTYTFTNLDSGHFIIIFPYIQILIGVAIWNVFRPNNFGKIIALLLIVSLISYYLNNCFSMVRELKRQDQEDKYSNVYVITQWLLDNKFYNIITFDNIFEKIRFNSNLKINPLYEPKRDEVWQYADMKSVRFAINNANPSVVFILKIYSSPYIKRMNSYFYTYARSLNKEVVVLKSFCKANGDVKYTLLYLK